MALPLPPTPAVLYAQAFHAHRGGRTPEALRVLEQLLQRAPRHADGWNLAGVIRLDARDYAGAAHCFEQAVASGAAAGVLVNLGLAQQRLGRGEAAAASFTEALRRDPGLALGWEKLAGLQEQQGDAEAALASYRRAIARAPGQVKPIGEALLLRRHLADWDPRQGPTPGTLLAALRAAPRLDFSPLLLLALPEADAALQREAGARFARSQWGPLLASPAPPAATPLEGRRLRLGYLSSDFREHAVAYLATEVLEAHDRGAVELFGYAIGPAGDDPWRRRVEAACEHFTVLEGLDDEAAAARLRGDRLDVLVDFNGYTQHGRPGLLARRPAPVQVSWIGYMGSLGSARLADTVIADAVALPPALEPGFSERVLRLPHCYQPNGRPAAPATGATREAEGLPADALVLCSFNQTFKLHPALFDDWCAVLRALPGAVLWLAPPRHASARRRLREEAARRGVAPEGVLFAEQRPREAHLARLSLADLALDTWPYNSGTTASDALRAGVPLLAFAGDTFAGRMAASLLHAAGLPECVAADRAACVAEAIRLGQDPSALAALRGRVAAARTQGPLFDPVRFARELEAALRARHAEAVATG